MVLYGETPGQIRANANLPGHFIYPLARLELHAEYMERMRTEIEKMMENQHRHGELCYSDGECWEVDGETFRLSKGLICDIPTIQRIPRTWQEAGMAPGHNPVRDFITPYSQFSRAESMKGSEQVVRGFQGFQPEGVEGIGEPNLAPKNRQSPSVIVYNGVRDGITQNKKGRFSGFGNK